MEKMFGQILIQDVLNLVWQLVAAGGLVGATQKKTDLNGAPHALSVVSTDFAFKMIEAGVFLFENY